LGRYSEKTALGAGVGGAFSRVTHWGATALFLAGVEGSSHHGIEKVEKVQPSCRSMRATSMNFACITDAVVTLSLPPQVQSAAI